MVENLQLTTGDGEMNANNRSVNIDGHLSGNTNINNGDNSVQTNRTQQGLSEQVFLELVQEIEENCDEQTSEQLKFFVEKLQEAYHQGNDDEGKKMIGFLKGALGSVGSLASIASVFGMSI